MTRDAGDFRRLSGTDKELVANAIHDGSDSRIAAGTGLKRKECSPGALELLAACEWPDNIREMENAIQRAVALGDGGLIEAQALPDRIRHVMIAEDGPHYGGDDKAGEQMLIEKALFNFEGDRTRAARFIGWTGTESEKMQVGAGREAICWGREGWREAA